MKVHYIDVGQGNAALVEFSCGAVLIDAGGGNDDVAETLTTYPDDFFNRRSDLNRTLDAVFITHTHVDHNLLNALTPDMAIISMGTPAERKSWTVYAHGHGLRSYQSDKALQ